MVRIGIVGVGFMGIRQALAAGVQTLYSSDRL
jgi:hypothetical protein